MKIDDIVQRIKDSDKFTPEEKEKLLKIVEWIRACINALRDAIRSALTFLRRHQEFAKVMGITILLALIAALVPFIGQLCAALTLIVGLGWAVAADLRANLDSLFQLVDLEKGATQI